MEVPVEFVLKFNGHPTQYEAIVVGSIPQLGKNEPTKGLKLTPSAAGKSWKGTVNIAFGTAFTYRYLIKDHDKATEYYETDVYHGMTLSEARLLSQLSGVKITDSWAKHDKVDLKLEGEHTYSAKVDAKSSVAQWPPVLDGEAAAAAAPAPAAAPVNDATVANLQAEIDDLQSQNTRLAADLLAAKAARDTASSQRREQRTAAREREMKLTRQVAELKGQMAQLQEEQLSASRSAGAASEEELEDLRMALQSKSTEIAALKSNEACIESQLASMKRRMLSANTQRETAQAAERAAALAKSSAEREAVSLRAQMETFTERLTELARQRVADKNALKKAEQAAATASEEAAAAEREASEAAAEARSAAAAVQTELRLREEEVDALRQRLLAAQAETHEASAAAERVAQEAAKGESAEVESLKQRLTALREEVQLAQRNAEQARGDVFQEQKRAARAEAEIAQWRDRTARVQAENKTLFNTILDLKGNIRVFARIRPMGATGNGDAAAAPAVLATGQRTLSVKHSTSASGSGAAAVEKKFKFDHVFDSGSSQEQVFAEVAPLVRSVLDGYNVCVFAYGQTGAGKTHTMQGSAAAPGVNVRALNDLFALATDRADTVDTRIAVSMCEIYNERVRDLLVRGGLQGAKADLTGQGGVAATTAQPQLPAASAGGKRKPRARGGKVDPEGLDLKQNTSGGTYAHGLTWLQVKQREDIDAVFAAGTEARSVSSTASNDVSSRSHMVFCVEVACTSKLPGKRKQGSTCARLFLIDLAGSERLKKSMATGARQAEAVAINKSLSALGDVMASLQGKAAHVPFRNSKLTLLLKDALGGNNKALMFAAVSPQAEDSTESVCSLSFAKRAGKVELGGAQRSGGGGVPARAAAAAAAASAGSDASMHATLSERVQSLQGELSRVREAEAAKDAELDAMATQVRTLEEEHEKQQVEQDEELSDLRSKVARFSSLLDGLAGGAPPLSSALSPVAGGGAGGVRRGGRRFSCVPMSAHKRKAIGDTLREIASPPAATFARAPPMPPLPASPMGASVATPAAVSAAGSPASMPSTPQDAPIPQRSPPLSVLSGGAGSAPPSPPSPEATDAFEALERSVLQDSPAPAPAAESPAPESVPTKASPGRGTKRQREEPAPGPVPAKPTAAPTARGPARSRSAALRVASGTQNTRGKALGGSSAATLTSKGKTKPTGKQARVGHRGAVLRSSSRVNGGTATATKNTKMAQDAQEVEASVENTPGTAAQAPPATTPGRSSRRKKFAHVASKIDTGRTPNKRARRGAADVSSVR